MDNKTLYGIKLWDEILKAIVSVMPEQLFPLIKEVYGKEYPEGTSIRILGTEQSTYLDDPGAPPSTDYTDISLLIANTDYYHIECQMRNDSQMVIRMIAYDLHFALQHAIFTDDANKEISIRFPRSVVIYPDTNNNLPDTLRCRIIFQDNSEHVYQIPTVRVQSYSLEEIHKKHLNLFIPYLLLRLKPRVKAPDSLTKKELTAFVESIIVILDEELHDGYLTERQYHDYINLLTMASARIFHKYPQYHREVLNLTKPLIKLPSVQIRELEEACAQKDAEMIEIQTKKDAEIAEMQNEILQLKQLLNDAGINLSNRQ